MKKDVKIGFKDVSWPIKIGLIGGFSYLCLLIAEILLDLIL